MGLTSKSSVTLTAFKAIHVFGALLCLLTAAGVQAQNSTSEQAVSGETEEPYRLEAITVTADKRAGSAQKVPTSMTVITDAELEDSRIHTAEELFNILPNIHLMKAGPAADIASGVAIRGISQTMSGSPSFGFYIDDVYYNEYDPNLVDIERVELLRGPQGTLYGRNAIGGVLNIVTKKPTDNWWTGHVEAGYGNHETAEFKGAISGPLVEDELFIRLSGRFYQSDGFMDNVFTGNDGVNQPEDIDGRVSVRYLPSDRLTVDFGLDALKYRSRYTDFVPLAQLDSAPDKANVDYEGESLKEALGANLRLEYAFDTMRFVSITAVRDDDNRLDHDLDFTPLDGQRQLYQRDYFTLSEELRLLSDDEESPLEWLVGLYLFKEEQDHNLIYTLGADFAMPAMGFFAGDYPITGASDILGAAIFGEASYTFDNAVKLTGGLRYDRETQDFEYDALLAGGTAGSTSETFDALLPKAVVSYVGSERYMPYASITRGYKSGGFNLQNNQGQPFDPEFTWNYEAGVKTNWDDGRLSFNTAIYYIDWEDLQVNASNGIDFVTDNAGSATSTGVELELIARPSPGLRLSGALAYTRSKYDDYTVGATMTQPASDFSGNHVPFIPDWTGNLGFSYRTPGGMSVGADYIYTGRVFMNNENTLAEPRYHIVNARLGYEGEDYEVYLWAKNLFDEKYATTYVDFTDQGGGLWARPGNLRTFGVSVRHDF